MVKTYEVIKELIEAGLGKLPCDLVLKNARLVNVYSGEIYPTNIYIKGKRIVSIDPDVTLEANQTIDCSGKYALPGLIDTHMHFEPTMMSPEALGEVLVPHGTTTVCIDPMEIANVAGIEGLKVLIQSVRKLPYRVLLEVSSRVPTAPGLETTGGSLEADQVREIMGWEDSVSLGELDSSKILYSDKNGYDLHKISDTLQKRKIVNGHAIGRTGQELNCYASVGISDDHECVTTEELIARLRVGMRVLIREGSTERNLDELISGVQKLGLGYENLMFCTDDKDVLQIKREGHINYNVNRAIALGVPAIEAVRIASVNAAKHFRLEDELGSITPGRMADILIVGDLNNISPETVLFEGQIVVSHGQMSISCPIPDYPEWIKNTIRLKREITPDLFQIKAARQADSIRVRVIELIERQIINRCIEADLSVCGGEIKPDVSGDILKLSVVERYGKTEDVGVAFVKGFGLKRGALAYSMSHDHHNIVVVGCGNEDMACAVNAIASMQGGMAAVCDGEVVESLPLKVGGLISDKSADEVIEGLARMNKAAQSLGCVLEAPFMTLSFISLPTVPELGLTDKGLIDVLNFETISVVI